LQGAGAYCVATRTACYSDIHREIRSTEVWMWIFGLSVRVVVKMSDGTTHALLYWSVFAF